MAERTGQSLALSEDRAPDRNAPDRSPLHAHARPPVRQLVISNTSLTLAQWLEVSWFYPDGFQKERIIESAYSWIVLGQRIAYKFFKINEALPRNTREYFEAQWRVSCREVLDNLALAPMLFLGLRVLRWTDDEPEWLSTYRAPDIDPDRPPPDANDVAIIMRRIPEDDLLHGTIRRTRRVPSSAIRASAALLARFHRHALGQPPIASHPSRPPVRSASSTRWAPPRRESDAVLSSRFLRRRYLTPLKQFNLTDAPYLDPFTQVAVHEVSAALERLLEECEPLIRQRALRRTVGDCHGSLRADRIARLSTEEDRRTLAIFGRLPRHHTFRINDVLSDVAALSADLQARGATRSARAFEEQYFTLNPSLYEPTLYRFFVIAESARRATLVLSGAIDDPHGTATSYLSLALRLAMNLSDPFLLVVGGDDPDACSRIARGVQELVGGAVVEPPSMPEGAPGPAPSPVRYSLETALRRCRHRIGIGQSVSLRWPLNRAAEREEILGFAHRLGIRALFLYAPWGRAEQLRIRSERPMSSLSIGSNTSEHRTQNFELSPVGGKSVPAHGPTRRLTPVAHELLSLATDLPLLVLEPSLPPAEIALHALRALRRLPVPSAPSPARAPSPVCAPSTTSTSPLRYSPSGCANRKG